MLLADVFLLGAKCNSDVTDGMFDLRNVLVSRVQDLEELEEFVSV